jgi:hypothetical protein
VLIENFTWDWIYDEYLAEAPRLQAHRDYLRQAFALADYHIQTAPAHPRPPAHLVTPPVSRPPRVRRAEVRDRLGIPQAAPMVLVTMGGIPEAYHFLDQLTRYRACYFVLPGGNARLEQHDQVTLLPHQSAFYHPDLIQASDAVVGKAGYSTVAETYHAGLPMGYVLRARFPESEVMRRFIERELPGLEIPEVAFTDGSWLAYVPRLLALPRRPRPPATGADQAAAFIWQRLAPAA